MPVYLFTLHGYRTWMPDHPRGYTTRDKGYQAPDPNAHERYESRANHGTFLFVGDLQRWMIDELIRSQTFIDVRLHGAATESTHIHFLVSWQHDRTWESVRRSLRTSMTKRVRAELHVIAARNSRDATHRAEEPPIFSDGGSRKHVHDRAHFNHLLAEYLPTHSGLQWYESTGWRDTT